ncbi:hypothetical protein JW899_04940 [Candidatus Uhrbacteria bacterium]|nr:hypothetical protein [Candidatus Uhrbacteria bacterium]
MKKKQVERYPSWSAEYILAHAEWQKSRGRKPSMPYQGIRNPKKALILALKIAEDKEFEDIEVMDADCDSFTQKNGWSFGIREEWGVSVKTGDIARFYGRGPGHIVRGLFINGVCCYYRTKEEQAEENAREIAAYEKEQKDKFEKNRQILDEKYKNLPVLFQKRIDKFRTNNLNFRWKYESYEMFCCEQAVVIATSISNQIVAENPQAIVSERAPSALAEFYDMPWEKQRIVVPDLDDGHSGNTFGCAVSLALIYLKEPENVVRVHGALAPLVGSEEYGDYTKAYCDTVNRLRAEGCLP